MRTRALPYLFVGPALTLLLLFGVLPVLVALGVSLTDMDIAGLADASNIQFIGLDNYQALFADGDFWEALGVTGTFVIVGVPAIVVISLAIAIALDYAAPRFVAILRTAFFVPAITGIVAVSLVWGYLYNFQFGLFNWILTSVGAEPVQWLSDPTMAKVSVGMVAVWRGIGLNTIILLAALQSIPHEYREAASLDGAGQWRTTFSIVLPLLRFALFFVTVTTTIAWLQFFDEPFVLTDGGPLGATTSISLFLYKEGFRLKEFGYASAGSVILFIVIAAVTIVQLRLRRADHVS
ncbi:carbohydrate ABC transporter permease [Demequina sp. NBRC 110052]|uniref:carbohydrate ABC transporter permease n=1 Tax=Demequina sp. NBRC 110052 TaxID=1570341 RepID=UPI0009FCA10C|nr:sugar ABC transporter permease [Demequina sp. NBRC 110052]